VEGPACKSKEAWGFLCKTAKVTSGLTGGGGFDSGMDGSEPLDHDPVDRVTSGRDGASDRRGLRSKWTLAIGSRSSGPGRVHAPKWWRPASGDATVAERGGERRRTVDKAPNSMGKTPGQRRAHGELNGWTPGGGDDGARQRTASGSGGASPANTFG
jgi:hypothetical protein